MIEYIVVYSSRRIHSSVQFKNSDNLQKISLSLKAEDTFEMFIYWTWPRIELKREDTVGKNNALANF